MNKKQILIVEDELIIAESTKSQLEKLGYKIPAIVDNAEDAVAFSILHRPDVILMDIHLKGNTDGITAAHHIQIKRSIPIIFITAFTEKELFQRAKATRPQAYLTKPINILDLQNNIELAIDRNESLTRSQKPDLFTETDLHEKIFTDFLEQSSDGIWITDENGFIITWNHELEKYFDLDAHQVLGKPLWDVIFSVLPENNRDADQYEQVKQNCLSYFNYGLLPENLSPIEKLIFKQNNKKESLHTHYRSIKLPDGYALGGVIRQSYCTDDPGERILQSISYWEATFNSVSEMILITDNSGAITRCNNATLRKFGKTEIEISEKTIDELFYGHQNELLSYLISKKEMQFPTIEGTFNISSYPLYLDQTISGKVYIITDISVNKEIEEVINASQKLSSLGTMAAGISHEINSPLQVIIGNSESMLKWIQKEKISRDDLIKSLESIHRNGWRVANIIRSLQVYAYSLTGDLISCNFNDLVKNALRITHQAHGFYINRSIKTELEMNLPAIMCNEADVTQVFINLISNAIDATPEGGIISIMTGKTDQNDRLFFKISDNGTGIPDEIRANIFDPFYTTKPVGKGVGLGLSISMGIIRAHGGDILLENSSQNGATFIVFLPVKPIQNESFHKPQNSMARFERFS